MDIYFRLAQFHMFKPGEYPTDLDSAKTFIDKAAALTAKIKSADADGFLVLLRSLLAREKGQTNDAKRSPKLTGEMLPYKGNSFVVKWVDRSMDADAFANFSLDQEGNPMGFTMRAISPLTDFSYDFQDLDFRRLK